MSKETMQNYLKSEIRKSLILGQPKNNICKNTNILNAEYCLGRISGYMNILAELDLDDFIVFYDTIKAEQDRLMQYVNTLYAE